ncbi:MAG: outer membrane protein beta-barrel domain [Gammaproteobacteria bacterium]|nr:outer membrane protein beta-barrel domain [Gammaproteobacteria bacterium]
MKMADISKLVLSSSLLFPLMAHADWSNHVYAGIGGGWQHTSIKTNNNSTVNDPIFNTYSTSTSINSARGAGLGNLFVGVANEQGTAYWAVEADAYYSKALMTTQQEVSRSNTADNDYYTFKMPWRFELDGIFGHYFTPTALGYFKIGATTGQLQTTYDSTYIASGGQMADFSSKTQLYGGVVGLGAQYALNSNWRLGVEADYIRFINKKQTVDSTYNGFPTTYALHYKPSQYLLKATLAYRFN